MARRRHKSKAEHHTRVKDALDRLRELAESRGQKLPEYVPRQPEALSTDTPPEPSAPAETKIPWQRSPLPPWVRRWTSYDAPRATAQNLAQRIVLIAGFLIILGMVLFPPWIYVFNPSADLRDRYVRVERPAGYHFMFADHSPRDLTQLTALFSLPSPSHNWPAMGLALFSVRLDSGRLQVQIVAALILTAILYLAFRSKQ